MMRCASPAGTRKYEVLIMSLDIGYYFRKPEKFPFPELLEAAQTPAELLRAAKEYIKANYPQGYIDKTAKIADSAVISGPVYIAANAEVAPHAYVRPYTIIGEGASVGHGSEVKASILFGGSKVASLSFVGDSVLGASARIGSGVITGNRKFDQSEVSVRVGSARYNLGSDYFGLVLGDSSRLGANCTSQPGTHIGHHTWVYPHITVRGFIPSQKHVMHKQELIITDAEIVELK